MMVMLLCYSLPYLGQPREERRVVGLQVGVLKLHPGYLIIIDQLSAMLRHMVSLIGVEQTVFR